MCRLKSDPTYKSLANHLDESSAFTELLIENITDYAICTVDLDETITSWSRGADQMYGYSSEEVIGRNSSLFYVPEDIERNQSGTELASALQNGRDENEAWRVRKDGSRFYVKEIVTVLRDDQTALGFLKITKNISERKYAEDTIRQPS